ncbi:DUF7553 family protein [Halorussus amylolyticus]|uniref:DUF7553 family protein n=1 Tax=Halorussus amylolyticus TaxID=1126242 RepID=UPI001045F0E0|nr:hypothetical protein [Halorussus amylolyticus]
MTENPREDLRDAAEGLDAVRETVSNAETADRLGTFAEQLRRMADAKRGPDHGRLDRLMHGLREVEADLSGEESEAVGSALAHVRAYRETVEGV